MTKFEQMAIDNPLQLVSMIKSGQLKNSELTYAVEALAKTKDSSLAVPCLFQLLEHNASVVREGVIYGLEGHLDYPGVKEQLKIMTHDTSEGVREAALEAME